jgi:hypothetical protein
MEFSYNYDSNKLHKNGILVKKVICIVLSMDITIDGLF